MKHVLISVGCNSYDFLNPLDGAEGDATRIYDLLTNDQHGDCDATVSRLILSPSLQELKEQLISATAHTEPGDLVTFFFAGHGCVKKGIFYLCLRDTQADKIGLTGLPLNNLLSLVNELAPKHANLIIDACNSGGVLGDFVRALSPDNVGSSGTIGISLLAACAQDQSAYEIAGAGVCTSGIARCIQGTTFVQDLTDHLDLIEVAAAVAQGASSTDQQPVFWGLNLTGRPNFCKNPHASAESPLRKTLAEATSLHLSTTSKAALHDLYKSLDSAWDATAAQHVLSPLHDPEHFDVAARITLTSQLIQSFRAKAQFNSDPFREIEVVTALLSPLLSCLESQQAEEFVLRECSALADSVLSRTAEVTRRLEEDDAPLLGDTGIGELFFLPIRVSKVLGWAGWATCAMRRLSPETHNTRPLESLVAGVLSTHGGALRCMSEEQAPFVVSIISELMASNSPENAEQLLGYYFSDACGTKGAVAKIDLDAQLVLDFLVQRKSRTGSPTELTANPSTLLASVLVLGVALDLDDAFDSGLKDLDHFNINAYIPSSYSEFSEIRMEGGYNATFRIGHDFWTIDDLRRLFDSLALPQPESSAVALLSAAASLLYPDRVAWHLVR